MSCPVTLQECHRPACVDGCGYIGNWPPPPNPEAALDADVTRGQYEVDLLATSPR